MSPYIYVNEETRTLLTFPVPVYDNLIRFHIGETYEVFHCVLESKSFLEKMIVLEHTIPFFLPLRDLENDLLCSNAKVGIIAGSVTEIQLALMLFHLIFSLSSYFFVSYIFLV